MRSLSNNRNNAIGPWYVYSNNGPSNANGNNWGGRTPTQGGMIFFLFPKVLRMLLNKSAFAPRLIKSDSVPGCASIIAVCPVCHAEHADGCAMRRRPLLDSMARFASQSPLKKHGLVGCLRPLEETCAERDALHSNFNMRRAA